MNLQKLVTVAGAGVTTFLLLGAVTIEIAMATIGGDIGPGIIGVFVGALAGLTAIVVVTVLWAGLEGRVRAVLLGYGAFGLALLFLAFLSYANAPGADEYLGFRLNLLIAAVVAVMGAALGAIRRKRDRSQALSGAD